MRPGIERLQRAELLGDHQRRVVGQHDAAGADADGRGAGGHVADDHRGRGAGDAGHVVVLGQPEAAVAPALGVAARGRGCCGTPGAASPPSTIGREVEDGEGDHPSHRGAPGRRVNAGFSRASRAPRSLDRHQGPPVPPAEPAEPRSRVSPWVKVPQSALRDLADDARIERGWRRLGPSLGPRRSRSALVPRGVRRAAGVRRRHPAGQGRLGPAGTVDDPAASGRLGSGGGGRRAGRPRGGERAAHLRARRRRGSRSAPGATVEVERGGTATRFVDLIQGEALIELHPGDAAPGTLRVVAADARLTLEAGSAVRVLRREGKLDVSVQKGGAALVSPTVEEHLTAGRRRLGVPIQAARRPNTSSAPPATGGRADGGQPGTDATWRRPRRRRRAAAGGRRAGGRRRGERRRAPGPRRRDDPRRTRARREPRVERVIERFEGDRRASIAAEKLATRTPAAPSTSRSVPGTTR